MTTLKPALAADGAHRALAGARALLLDLDGVIVLAGEAVPGAAEAIASLEARGIPYRIVTNTSPVSRATLAGWSAKLGAPDPGGAVPLGPLGVGRATARHFPGAPLYVLGVRGRPDASSTASTCSRTTRPARAGAVGGRRGHRRLARGRDVRQPRTAPSGWSAAARSSSACTRTRGG